VPVVELDARLLTAGRAALDAAVADSLGAPALLVVRDVDTVDPHARARLTELPFLVAAVGASNPEVAAAVDVVLDDEPAFDALRTGFGRAPIAATAAALLLRARTHDWWEALVRESTTYSMLQAGPEFDAWRVGHQAGPAPADHAARVRHVRHERLTEIVLTRAGRHNALDRRLRDELDIALDEATTQDGPIVVLGDGPSFCSGGDLDEFGTLPNPALAHLVRLGRSLATRFARAQERLVVGVHGSCLGSGIELPAFADHVVAADDARIGLPELDLGLVPGAGGTVSLPARIGRHRTLHLLVIGGTISAPVALDWGLVDEVVPPARLRSRCFEIAGTLL
jgi:enoyl-CoA hydratase/carnithine racemase